jgi:type IV secretion system protein TrbE
LGARLHRWIDGGRYAAMFDNPRDTLTMERLQFFDFESMRSYPSLLDPLLLYILHRFNERLHDPTEIGTLKVCVMDEAWMPIQHHAVRAYVRNGLKTWRKWNAALLMATQSIEDFASAELLRAVVESCPTRLLLANPSMDRGQYRDLLQMNEMELMRWRGSCRASRSC